MTALRGGLLALLTASLLYEPVRLNLYRLGNSVGGVGGVGGLTNQWGCRSTGGVFGGGVCYHDGLVFGLTPFALVVLLSWTMPLAASALVCYLHGKRTTTAETIMGFGMLWPVAELLWFGVPASLYFSDPFYRSDFWHVILGVAIAAAFPLSWNLALVAIPAPTFVAASAGFTTLMNAHQTIGWAVVRWGLVHGTGELAYIIAKDKRVFVTGPYSLLYWAGAASFSVLLVHAIIARSRRKLSNFALFHKTLAAVLLLCATVHWWPFAFFLCPAVATLATAHALSRATKPHDDPPLPSLLLATSLMAVVLGVCVVWQLRELTLQRVSHTLFAYPFPPLALGLGYVLARLIGKALLLKLTPRIPSTPLRRGLLLET